MHDQGFFFQAFVYLAAAVVSVPLAKLFGMGSVLGYLVAGAVIGPSALGWVGQDPHDIMAFAEFGVVMMLFLVGLELELKVLWNMRSKVLGLGATQMVATAAAIGTAVVVAGRPIGEGVAVGLILAMSSTAIALQMLGEKELLQTPGGRASFSVLLFQDLAVIPILALLPLLATSHPSGGHDDHAGWFDRLPSFVQGPVVVAAVLAIVVGGRYLLRPVFRYIARTKLRELFVAGALLLVIGIALLMTEVGLSPALGTFLAGVVLADSEYRHELESDIEPFKGLLLGLFFISVGASISVDTIARDPLAVALAVVGLVVVKFAVVVVATRLFKIPIDQSLLAAAALAQGGEFAFVLFAFAAQNGVLAGDVTEFGVLVVALSMAVTSVLMLLHEKVIAPRLGRPQATGAFDEMDERHPVIIAGYGRYGQICARVLDACGIGVTVLELDSELVEFLRKFGRKVFYGDACRVDLLHAAGAHQAKLFIVAVNDADKAMELVETVRRHFPHLTILARATGRVEAFNLYEAGLTHVYRETFDSALRTATDALRLLGIRAHQAERLAKRFRRRDEALVEELARERGRSDFIDVARARIAGMEAVLKDDLKRHDDLVRDHGWDSAPLVRGATATLTADSTNEVGPSALTS